MIIIPMTMMVLVEMVRIKLRKMITKVKMARLMMIRMVMNIFKMIIPVRMVRMIRQRLNDNLSSNYPWHHDSRDQVLHLKALSTIVLTLFMVMSMMLLVLNDISCRSAGQIYFDPSIYNIGRQ